MIRIATPTSRLEELPEGLSLEDLIRDHMASSFVLTGRRLSPLEAARELDAERGVKGRDHDDRRPCDCSWCVSNHADANAEEPPLDRPIHVHSRECYDDAGPGHGSPSLICGHIAGEPEPVHQGADAAEFGLRVHADTDC